jgi:flagellar biosynthetic protein FlhB
MGEKTESPTPRRLSEARERGQVVRSVEINSAVGMLAAIWLIQGPGRTLAQNLGTMIRQAFTNFSPDKLDVTPTWLQTIFINDLSLVMNPMMQILFGIMILGLVVNLAQSGFVWAGKRQAFDFGRLNPLSGFKRMFSLQGVVNLLKALLKLGIVGWVAYTFLRDNLAGMLELASMDLMASLTKWMGLVVALITRVGGAYLVLAAVDYAYQRWEYMRQMRMSKQEVLDEIKQTEGDPFMRARIRQQQRRMARMRMMAAVPKADVVITNPTHLAVAISYDDKSMKAPRLLAKGAYQIAERIVKIARENNITVTQNIPLARAIYKNVEIDQEIPPDLYVAMAEVLAYVYRLRGKKITETS